MSKEGSSQIGEMVNRVGVRVPPFYPSKPHLWFASLESQFALSGVTADSTKYHYALSYLEPEHIEIVEDIIASPAAPDKYEKLKTELIKRLSASREKQVKQLLHHEELGDRKPSQFLRRLQTLAGTGVPDDFIRTLWASRLPVSVQPIIASQPNMKLEQIAELADQVLDVVTPSLQVAGLSAGTSGSNEIAALTKQVEALTTKLDRMARSRSKPDSTSHRRGRSKSRSQSNYRKFPVCWYHHKYGDKARECIKPCDFAGNAKGSR